MVQAACHACLLPEHAPISPDVERIVMSLLCSFFFSSYAVRNMGFIHCIDALRVVTR